METDFVNERKPMCPRGAVSRALARLSAALPLRLRVALILGLLFLVWSQSDTLITKVPEKRCRDLSARIAAALRDNGMVAASSFDGPFPVETLSGRPVAVSRAPAVPGARDGARRLPLDKDAFLQVPSRWDSLGDSYTLFLRLAFHKDGPASQNLCSTDDGRVAGFLLEDGRLRFYVPVAEGGSTVLEAPAPPFGRKHVHSLVAVADASSGRAALYVDGVPAAERALHPAPPSGKYFRIGHGAFFPADADIDEFAVWSRPLSADEIRRASAPAWSPAESVAPFLSLRIRLLRDYQQFGETCARMVRKAHSWPAVSFRGVRVPVVDLRLSVSDLRHFDQEHAASVRSGFRTENGADWRKIEIGGADRSIPARLSLDDAYSFVLRSGRPSFLLDIPENESGLPPGVLRLYAPEDYLALHLGDEVPVETDLSRYVRLRVGNRLLGLYVAEPFGRLGGAAVAEWDGRGPGSVSLRRPARPFRAHDLLSETERRKLVRETISAIRRDTASSWSGADWKKARITAEALAKDYPRPAPDAMLALGANPAPWYVTTDLDLSHPAFSDVARWTSSRPDLVAPDGRVSGAGAEAPTAVELVGLSAAGRPAASLKVRVMPRERKIPAFFLSVGTPPSKTRRADFTLRVLPAGTGDSERVLTGFVGDKGGLGHRGNSSYARGMKKPLSLKFSEPHRLLESPDSRLLYLLNGFMDDSRIRNALCYDTARHIADAAGRAPYRPEEGAAAPPPAPRTGWCELFVNGEYMGVYELSSRIHEETFPGRDIALFKDTLPTAVFAENSSRAFLQTAPDPADSPRRNLLLDFMDIACDPVDSSFLARLRAVADMDSLVSWFLLLNFSGNRDGMRANFYLAHESAREKPYFVIPWDYDKSFVPEWIAARVVNRLHERLLAADPDFAAAAVSRWKALRAPGAPLDEHVLMERISRDEALLAPAMPFEFGLLGRPEVSYAERVDELRGLVRRRLALVDAWTDELEGAGHASGAERETAPAAAGPEVPAS